MRLVCPNCEAKYEVPEDAIPETGRDVQCANCGHAWFQMRPRAAGAETVAAPVAPPAPEPVAPQPIVEPATVAPVEDIAPVVESPPAPEDPAPAEASPVDPEPEAAPVVEVVAAEDSVVAVAEGEETLAGDEVEVAFAEIAPADDVIEAAETVAADPVVEASAVVEDIMPVTAVGAVPAVEAMVADAVLAEDAQAADEAGDASDADAPAAAPAAYAVDESVLAILREEAEREAVARRAEAARPLETQTDLGIEAAIPAAKKPVETIPAAEPEVDDTLSARRTRLPDVEEINSTLRPAEMSQDESMAAEAASQPAEGRSSFRSGFLLVLTVAILGSAIYGSADALAQAVPALAGPLKAYVGFVDSLRLQLDGLMQSATVAINGN
ncbi:zinc-ribbon domain-containing protein [Tabrizicola sp.]|uniref:zinc-ribbon domain-containing protein n=1 Tax=Tabrizicola sp. TaxID=2005166 RepID=UPI002FDEB908